MNEWRINLKINPESLNECMDEWMNESRITEWMDPIPSKYWSGYPVYDIPLEKPKSSSGLGWGGCKLTPPPHQKKEK